VHGDKAELDRLLAGQEFDVVVDWIAFTPEDIERDLQLFSGGPANLFSSAPPAPTRNHPAIISSPKKPCWRTPFGSIPATRSPASNS